jgi:phosphohistidine phosphatase
VRSLSTGRGVGKVLGIAKNNIRIIPEIYGADGEALFSVVKNTDHTLNDIVLIGHEPALSELLEILTGSHPDKFPTCAVYRIRFDTEDWKNIKPKKGMCEIYVNPKILEEKES